MLSFLTLFFFHDPATPEIYTLSLHDALPICGTRRVAAGATDRGHTGGAPAAKRLRKPLAASLGRARDRKSTRLNSSHEWISYAVFCLKKKRKKNQPTTPMSPPNTTSNGNAVG